MTWHEVSVSSLYRPPHRASFDSHGKPKVKIECYHRSLKNVIKLQNFYYPWELEQAIEDFVDYYNHHRYHELQDNLTPADAYFGRVEEVKTGREWIK